MRKALPVMFFLLWIVPAFGHDGQVVVCRPKKFVGSALKPSVYVDGTQVARLENGRYVSLRIAVGRHEFESSMKHTAPLQVDVKPKETTYLEMVILPGNWPGGGRLIPVGENEAKSAIDKLKPLDANEIVAAEASGGTPQQEPGIGFKEERPAANEAQASSVSTGAVSTESPLVAVKSTPEGADISVDAKHLGSTPSTLRLAPGEHTISIEKPGFKPWHRTMTVVSGGSLTVDATLESETP